MGGYFESKRLKLPQTSTTAELHRPLTLSQRALEYCIGARSMLMDLLSREYTRTQIERRRMYIQTSRKEKKKEKEKSKKKCMLSRLLSKMSLRGKSRYTQTQDPYLPGRLPIEHSNLRHMKRSNLPFDLFFFKETTNVNFSSLVHCHSIAFP